MARRFQDVWIDQCAAARDIKRRFGSRDAFDYLVGEKLMTYADTAVSRPEFARELPRFVAEVRRVFNAEEIGLHMPRIERDERTAARGAKQAAEGDRELADAMVAVTARQERFYTLKLLLSAEALGTS